MRPSNFEEMLKAAKEHPDLQGALSKLGYTLHRVGYGRKYNCVEYKIAGGAKGVAGDFSSVVFCENSDGRWSVLDNKQRNGILAYDAIGALTELFGLTFDNAVELLSEGRLTVEYAKPQTTRRISENVELGEFKEPQRTDKTHNSKAFAYLRSRGISAETITALIDEGLIYQSEVESKKTGKLIPVAVFPIYNQEGTMVGADSIGTYNLQNFKFKHIYSGSDPNYGWHFANNVSQITAETPLFFCESPIDAMSLFELYKYDGVYVSMSGCKDVTFEGMNTRYGGKAVICTDNDEAGNKFRARHKEAATLVPPSGKDWNDVLNEKPTLKQGGLKV